MNEIKDWDNNLVTAQPQPQLNSTSTWKWPHNGLDQPTNLTMKHVVQLADLPNAWSTNQMLVLTNHFDQTKIMQFKILPINTKKANWLWHHSKLTKCNHISHILIQLFRGGELFYRFHSWYVSYLQLIIKIIYFFFICFQLS